MAWSNGITASPVPPTKSNDPQSGPTVFTAVMAVLFASGWAANHFAALIPAIRDSQHLKTADLDAIFGIYAVGLLPGLLGGGRASDAFGRSAVALAGVMTTLLGTIAMQASQQPDVLLVGRLIVGAGVGLAVSSCTAWASDLRGTAGAAMAGMLLMAGFAVGPFASGAISSAGQAGVGLSFGIAAVLVIAAMVGAVVALRCSGTTAVEPTLAAEPSAGQGTAEALSWAIPLAPWVFVSATIAFVTIPDRVHTGLAAPLAAGTAALIANGASGLSQLVARRRQWGPRAGTIGALLAAVGYTGVAVSPMTMPLWLGLSLVVLLGCASGLCLREGLMDLEAAAPQHIRGTLTGAFYATTYLGFAVPLILTLIGSVRGSAMILAALAALALAAAVTRAIRLRRNSHRRK